MVTLSKQNKTLMKIKKHLFILLFGCTTLLCCNEPKKESSSRNETPEVLKDEDYVSSYSRSRNDLIERLYAGLVEKSDTLKRLETEIKNYKSEKSETNEKFDKFDMKSKSYYFVAELDVKAIKDSLLRKQIFLIIKDSKKKYRVKTKELNLLIEQIDNNNTAIEDYYSVMKIIKTLPLVEKYQTDNLLKSEEFKKLIEKQNKLNQQIQTITPKY